MSHELVLHSESFPVPDENKRHKASYLPPVFFWSRGLENVYD